MEDKRSGFVGGLLLTMTPWKDMLPARVSLNGHMGSSPVHEEGWQWAEEGLGALCPDSAIQFCGLGQICCVFLSVALRLGSSPSQGLSSRLNWPQAPSRPHLPITVTTGIFHITPDFPPVSEDSS